MPAADSTLSSRSRFNTVALSANLALSSRPTAGGRDLRFLLPSRVLNPANKATGIPNDWLLPIPWPRVRPFRHLLKRYARSFPQHPRRAIARRVQRFNVNRMQPRPQPQRPTVVALRIPRRAADLRERRAGLRHFHAIDHQPRAVAIDKMKRVAAIGGNVDESIPRCRVARESLRARPAG